MQLLALDADFQPVAYLPFFNLQWTREYYQIGNFSVQIAAADYQPTMAYLYTPDRPETGIIQKVELTETVKGRFVQLSGYFLEAILNDKVVYPAYYATGTIPAAVVAMLTTFLHSVWYRPAKQKSRWLLRARRQKSSAQKLWAVCTGRRPGGGELHSHWQTVYRIPAGIASL